MPEENENPDVCIICGRQASYVNDDGAFCEQCHSILYFQCDECHEWYRATNRHSMNRGDRHVCDQCYESIGAQCEHCGNDFTMDNLTRYRGQMCCHSCINEIRRHRGGIGGYHSHDYSVPDDGELRFGFELETGDTGEDDMLSCVEALKPLRNAVDEDDENYDSREDMFYLEHDGSIPDYGFELISTPHTLEEYRTDFKKWNNILALLREWGLHAHYKCGLHIHASKQFMDSLEWYMVGWFVNENRERFEQLARREGNDYAEYYSYGSFSSFSNNIDDMDRYSAVNYHSSQYTIEFRMFASTTNINTLYEDLELIDALVRWVKLIHTECLDQLIIETPRTAFASFKTFIKEHNYDKANALIERKGV